MKKLIKLAVLAVVALVVLVLLGAFFLDSLIVKGVETAGPQITKTDVTLAGAKISPLTGRGELLGFVIGNPEGYKTPSAISLGKVSLSVKPGSIMSDKIIVKSFVAEAPEITLEGGLKENNLSKLLENVNSVAGSDGKKKDSEPKSEGREEDATQTRIQVDEFLIKDAKVKVSIKGMFGQTFDISLPDVELKNLGQGEEGITVAELSELVLNAILDQTVSAASDGMSGGALENLKKGDIGGAAESIKNIFK